MLVSLFIGFCIGNISLGYFSGEWGYAFQSLYNQTLALIAVGTAQYLGV